MMLKIDLKAPKSLQNTGKTGGFGFVLNKTSGVLDISLRGIVGNEATQSDAESIVNLLKNNPDKPLVMRINSPGGDAMEGVDIYNAIVDHPATTTTIIDPLAGSAASLIAIAADKVQMRANGVFHLHEGISGVFGHVHEIQRDLPDVIAYIELFNAAAAEMYASKTGKSVEQIREVMFGNGDGTRYGAQAAKDFGFVDEIITASVEKPKRSIKSHLKTKILQARVDIGKEQR
jgi:ATP-dependent protease ClpP protease subunit